MATVFFVWAAAAATAAATAAAPAVGNVATLLQPPLLLKAPFMQHHIWRNLAECADLGQKSRLPKLRVTKGATKKSCFQFFNACLSFCPSFLHSCYILYIYICCEVIIWSKFGVFKCYYLVQVGVFKCYYLVQVCFLIYKNSGFKRFGLHTQLSFCVFFLCPIIWQFSKNSLFQKKGAKIGFFNFQCFKYKIWKFSFFGLLKHYKNRGFSIFLCFLLLREKKTGKKKW